MGKPVLSPEQQKAKDERFWIKPGVVVVLKAKDRPIMTVDRIDARVNDDYMGKCPSCQQDFPGPHGPTPERTWCKNGKLFRRRNFVKGIICRWIDEKGEVRIKSFLVKDLKKHEDDAGAKT